MRFKEKIVFAVIGASGICDAHINALKHCPGAEIKCIWGRDRRRVEAFASRHGIMPCYEYEEVLRDRSVDAVDIVTEPVRHGTLALAAMEQGKHVLIEKPLDIDIEMAKRVLEMSAQVDRAVAVISQKRFDPKINVMKKELESGNIGLPYLVEVKLLWNRNETYYHAGSGWRAEYGNVLLNQGIHWVDILLWFFGPPVKIRPMVKKVKESISCYDTAVVGLEFSGNILCNLVCSTALTKNLPEEFTIYGTSGRLDYRSIRGERRFLRRMGPPHMSPLGRQISHYTDCIVGNRPPVVSVEDACRSLEVVQECDESFSRP
jgi:predicted dehydrogenase